MLTLTILFSGVCQPLTDSC